MQRTEHSVFAKCAWRLVPFVVLLFTVNFLDRVNVGFAALAMNRDLGFSPAVFGFGAGVFFAGYFLFEIPSNIVIARVGARRWIFTIMVLWGGVSAGCAFVRGADGFYLLRFLLGVAEAGFFPGVVYYLTLWFPSAYRARFAACLIAAGPVANIIGGPLSGMLLNLDGLWGLKGWQWLFLMEGIPASLMAVGVLKAMPNTPRDAFWLTAQEKEVIARRLAVECAVTQQNFWLALRDPSLFALCLTALCMQSGLFGIGLWLPQIVHSMGFSTLATGWVVVPPYVLSASAMMAWGWHSDRAGERVWHLAAAAFVGAGGLVAASLSSDNAVVLLALMAAMIGIHATFGPFWGIPSFLSDKAAAGGLALINSIGSLGGFLAPTYIGMLRQATGGYGAGMAVLALELLLAGLVALALGPALSSTSGTAKAASQRTLETT